MRSEVYIPLRQGEATEIQLLWACREVVDTCEKKLEKRFKAIGRWPQFRAMQKQLANMTNDIMTTIEPKKAHNFLVNLMNQEIRVCSKGMISPPKDYTLIPSQALSDILQQAMKDTCMICYGDGCDMAKCQFRKTVKQLMMFEIEENDGTCMGKKLLQMVRKDEV